MSKDSMRQKNTTRISKALNAIASAQLSEGWKRDRFIKIGGTALTIAGSIYAGAILLKTYNFGELSLA